MHLYDSINIYGYLSGVKIELSGEETPNRRKDSYNQKPYPESYYQFSSHDGQNLDQDDAQDRISLDPVNTLINVSGTVLLL